MSKKFTLLLLGPAGTGKSLFVSNLSQLDIRDYIVAQPGNANTTKLSVTYEFSNDCTGIEVVDCIPTKQEDQEDQEDKESLLDSLQKDSEQPDGIANIFQKINNEDFSKKCISLTIKLPCKEGILPDSKLFDTIVVKDGRGFGDVKDNEKMDIINDVVITDDVNAILLFFLDSSSQPNIFENIIKKVLENNLNTPIFRLRRQHGLTNNDFEFQEKIINNISKTDEDLAKVISNMDITQKKGFLNNLVVKIPEVGKWVGEMYTQEEDTNNQIEEYTSVVKSVVQYAIEMYDKLYKALMDKMKKQYKEEFNKVLDNLKSDAALNIAAKIVREPNVQPSEYYNTDRDTMALLKEVNLYKHIKIDEKLYHSEKNQAGVNSIIPSYSYSCINFRNIFPEIVDKLTEDDSNKPLFKTFMSIMLKEYTVTAYSGYVAKTRETNAFKFDYFVKIRNQLTNELKDELKDNFVNEWCNFYDFKPNKNKYHSGEAIATLMYWYLVCSLKLNEKVKNDNDEQLNKEFEDSIEAKDKISNLLSRK